MSKKPKVHNRQQISGDVSARQEGFGSEAEREGGSLARAGQSGDLQGLSDIADADSESVAELLEEGQVYEAEVIAGVERASHPDSGPLHPREVSEDDVPTEYDDQRD